jgi:hypothetical protein
MQKNKIININDLKKSVEKDFEEKKNFHLNLFLENIEKYKKEQNLFFEEGFKLGLLCGEYQFYFEKLYDYEVLDKEISEDEMELINFFRIKEEEYFGTITVLNKATEKKEYIN